MCAVTVEVLHRSLVAAVAVPTSCGNAVGVVLKMNEHERARSRFGATSGCVTSTPHSITPTLTPRPVAPVHGRLAVAPIRLMSHWHDASGSLDGLPNEIGRASCRERV